MRRRNGRLYWNGTTFSNLSFPSWTGRQYSSCSVFDIVFSCTTFRFLSLSLMCIMTWKQSRETHSRWEIVLKFCFVWDHDDELRHWNLRFVTSSSSSPNTKHAETNWSHMSLLSSVTATAQAFSNNLESWLHPSPTLALVHPFYLCEPFQSMLESTPEASAVDLKRAGRRSRFGSKKNLDSTAEQTL